MFDPISLGVYIGSSLLQIGLSARAQRKKFDEFQLPSIDETLPIPYVAGTIKLTRQALIWSGDFKTSSVRTEMPGWLNWLAPVTAIIDQIPLGTRYYLGNAFGLCRGPVDALEAVYVNDKQVWSGSSVGGTLSIHAPGAFGPDGGVSAIADFAPGGGAQLRNPYLATKVANVPGFRGTAVFYWRGGSVTSGYPKDKIKYSGYVGRSPALKPFAFRVKRCPNNLGTAYSRVNTHEANFAEIIYDLLISDVGLALPSSEINTASFVAAAQTLHAEGLGCSFKWEEKRSTEEVLQDLIDTIDAVLFTSFETGQITLKLIRDDYTVGSLPIFDKSNIIEVNEYSRSAADESLDELRVSYEDIANEFKERTAIVSGISGRASGVGSVSTTIKRLGLGNAAAAQKVATRDFKALTVPLARATLKVNRQGFNLTPGSVFKFTWEPLGITQLVMRVGRINFGTLRDGAITIHAVEDRFSIGESMFAATVTSGWSDPVPPTLTDSVTKEVISKTTTTPPAAPATGDAYVIPTGASGVWTGKENQLATWNGTAWVYEETADLPNRTVYNQADSKWQYFDGATNTWKEVPLGLKVTEVDGAPVVNPANELVVANTDLTQTSTGVARVRTASDVPGGDVIGTPGALTVAAIRTVLVHTTPPLDGQVLKYNAVNTRYEPSATAGVDDTATLLFEFGDGVNTSSLAANQTARIPYVPFNCSIVRARITGNPSGSAVVDIQKSASDPPSFASIAGSAKPTLSSDNFVDDVTLSGWSKALAVGNELRAVLQSVSGCSQVTVVLVVQRT